MRWRRRWDIISLMGGMVSSMFPGRGPGSRAACRARGGWVGAEGDAGGQRCSASRWSQRMHRGGASSCPQNCSSFVPAPHARQDAGHLVPGAGGRQVGGGEHSIPREDHRVWGGRWDPKGLEAFRWEPGPECTAPGWDFPGRVIITESVIRMEELEGKRWERPPRRSRFKGCRLPRRQGHCHKGNFI